MKLFATVVLIASWICKCTVDALSQPRSSSVGSINAGECLVHNQPAYLSITDGKTGRNSDGSTVSTFAANLATILGLSSDQVSEEPVLIIVDVRFYSNERARRLESKSNRSSILRVHWTFHRRRGYSMSKDSIVYSTRAFH